MNLTERVDEMEPAPSRGRSSVARYGQTYAAASKREEISKKLDGKKATDKSRTL